MEEQSAGEQQQTAGVQKSWKKKFKLVRHLPEQRDIFSLSHICSYSLQSHHSAAHNPQLLKDKVLQIYGLVSAPPVGQSSDRAIFPIWYVWVIHQHMTADLFFFCMCVCEFIFPVLHVSDEPESDVGFNACTFCMFCGLGELIFCTAGVAVS